MNITKPKKEQHMIAGIVGGFASTVTLFPLDLIKVRYQVHEGKGTAYSSLIQGFRHIFHTEGTRGLYRGLTSAVVASTVSWGGYFYFYENSKNRKLSSKVYNQQKLDTSDIILSGFEAGALMVCITNPIWLIKTRLQIQGNNPHMRKYNGLLDALKVIPKEEGILGLYKGSLPALLLTSHGAIQFGWYEASKVYYNDFIKSENVNDNENSPHGPPAWFSSTMGGVSKIFATIMTYPLQVVKSRLQQQQQAVWINHVQTATNTAKYSGVLDCIKKIYLHEGGRGFFKGIVANIFRTAPSSAITLAVFDCRQLQRHAEPV